MSDSRIVVMHSGYGCDTGCCGHVIEWGDQERFVWEHPGNEDPFEWAKNLIASELGAEHVADLDWENCLISDGW